MFNPNVATDVASKATNTNTTANTAENTSSITQSWPLMAFRKLYKRLQYCPKQVNKQTGEIFQSLAFTKADGTIDYVGFSQKLGVLTPDQIMEQKQQLQVCLLSSGTYKLCRAGQNDWLDLDLNEF